MTEEVQTQRVKILEYLKKGKALTPLQALDYFGCYRVSARILELRNKGYNIKTELVKENKKRFAKYRLIQ